MNLSYEQIVSKHLSESLYLIDIIEKNNSDIIEEKIIHSDVTMPINYNHNTKEIKILDEFKKTMENKNILDGYNVLLSLLALEDVNNKLFHLLSLDVKTLTFHVNLSLLSKIDIFPSIYIEQLAKIDNMFNLKDILRFLYLGFKYNFHNAYFDYSKFEILDEIGQIKFIQELINAINHNNLTKFRCKKIYFLFYSSDYNLFHNIKEDLNELKNNYTSIGIKMFIDTLNEKVININLPISFSYVNNHPYVKTFKLSETQLDSLNKHTKNYYSTIGFGGSGKTYLISLMMKYHLLLHTIYYANNRKSLPICYTSYTNLSNETIINNLGQSYKDVILLTDTNNQFFSSCVDKKVDDLNKVDFKRLIAIDEKLKQFYEIGDIFNTYEESFKSFNVNVNKFPTSEIKNQIKNILKDIESKRTKYKKAFIFTRWFSKDQFTITMPLALVKKLNYFKKLNQIKSAYIFEECVNIQDFEKFEIELKRLFNLKLNLNDKQIDYNAIKTIAINDFYINKINKHECDVDKLDNFLSLSEDDIIYYAKFCYLLNESNKSNVELILNYISSFKEQPSGDKNLYIQLTKKISKDTYESLLKSIFPITISSVSNLRAFIPINYGFYQTFIDESLLVPCYFLYSILGRTKNITLFGDVSQMTFSHLVSISQIKSKIEAIYENDIELLKKYNLFLNIKNSQKSIFDILKSNKNFFSLEDNGIITDNFRNKPEIVKSMILLSNEYQFYLKEQYKSKISNFNLFSSNAIESINKISDLITINNNNIIPLTINGESKNVTYLLKQDDGMKNFLDKYKELFDFLSKQDELIKNKISILIVTPTKEQVSNFNTSDFTRLIEEQTFISKYFIGYLDEIQGLEFDVVIFDTFYSNSKFTTMNILNEKPKRLSVCISRAKQLFIFIGDENSIISNSDIKDSELLNFIDYIKQKKLLISI